MIPKVRRRPGNVGELDRFLAWQFGYSAVSQTMSGNLVLIGQLYDDRFMMDRLLAQLPVWTDEVDYQRYLDVFAADDILNLLPDGSWNLAGGLSTVRIRFAATCLLRMRDLADVNPQPFVKHKASDPEWVYLGHMLRDREALPTDGISRLEFIGWAGAVELLGRGDSGIVQTVFVVAGGLVRSYKLPADVPSDEPHIVEARQRLHTWKVEGIRG